MEEPGSDLIFLKGEGEIEATPQEVFNIIHDFEARPKYDEMFESGKTVLEVDANTLVRYESTKPPAALVWARDYLIVVAVATMKEGSIVRATKSIEDSKIPPVDGYVRANVLAGGWVLRPIEGGAKTQAIYCFKVDPKGFIPKTVVNWGARSQVGVIDKIRQIHNPKLAEQAEKEKPRVMAAVNEAKAMVTNKFNNFMSMWKK
eukprot:TRINITY_DN1216_c0_g1_i12.p1 TRINITY_DN1216_c0_g1~~TRINITY_DN1216_c0_g1_i12.p1  ORF type:complete len:203 (-),score=45.97 TRINITY_DN1216_c0_g1_i12:433-1041(-)